MDHNKLWKILKEMGIPDYLICLLRNLYAGPEATVRTGHGTIDWFQIGKGVHQGCISSPCLFNLYADYIMQNARLDEAQAGIKIARRNINNLTYADGAYIYLSIYLNIYLSIYLYLYLSISIYIYIYIYLYIYIFYSVLVT